MKVVAVGTSCTWFERNNTSFVVDDDIIFDIPAGNYKALVKLGVMDDISKIRAVLISHFHSDHFGDFHIFSTRISREVVLDKKCVVYGPTGILDRVVEYNRVLCGSLDELDRDFLSKNLEFIELYDGMKFKLGKYDVKAFLMSHGTVETYGFTFTFDGVTVGFSADTAPCENLDKILEESDFAFVDCASMKKHKSHLSVFDFDEIVKRFPKTKIFPIHTADPTYDYVKGKGYSVVDDGDEFNF